MTPTAMASSSAPTIVGIAGPNGAGKSTAAQTLLRGTLAVDEFVNADTLARGLSAFRPEAAAIEAGRIMLRRLDHRQQRRPGVPHELTSMSEHKPTIDELFEDGREIDEALLRAAREARRLHKRLGHPMATWQDGKVVWVQPEDIVVNDLPPDRR